nr:YibE/F family protein [Feifania hominis]
MTVRKRKDVFVYLSTVVFSILFILVGNRIAMRHVVDRSDSDDVIEQAKVTKIVERVSDDEMLSDGEIGENTVVTFVAEITKGERKGMSIVATQAIESYESMTTREVQQGDRILLYERTIVEGEDPTWVFGEYLRTPTLYKLLAIFFVAILLFGRFKGFNTIVSLAFTCLAVFAVFIPSILSGYNIYFWSILVSVFITAMTLLLIYGASQKSLAAALGCIGGVLVAGALTLIMDRGLMLTGITSEDSVFLLYLDTPNPISLKAIIFAAIIIGAIGAIMDVSISISSALSELRDNAQNPTFGLLLRSGLSIGRDMMGTMANTLILAYIGSSLSTVVLLVAYNSSLLELFNREMIVVEILQSLVGSLGMLLTIPLTSLISASLYTGRWWARRRSPQPVHEDEEI